MGRELDPGCIELPPERRMIEYGGVYFYFGHDIYEPWRCQGWLRNTILPHWREGQKTPFVFFFLGF
jgi:hypothetical protein